jgi:hypothetical protein
MDREQIIRMAREAGFVVGVSVEHWGDVPFAKLCHPTPTSTALYRMLESLVSRAVAAEREACAELVWPTQQVKVWSDKELTDMTGAFNRAQEKHGWYETIMAVGATALKDRAAAIRARGQQ